MNDDAQQIAEYLAREHGLDGAIVSAQQGTAEAQRDGDNYALSVWREVKNILRKMSERAA